jgi:hypothetical protein
MVHALWDIRDVTRGPAAKLNGAVMDRAGRVIA